MQASITPKGFLALRTIAMPADTNMNGDIFGGWLVSRMDMAAAVQCRLVAESRVVTVAIQSLTFMKPVYVGDMVSCYAEIIKIGHTSMQVKITVWTLSLEHTEEKQVAEGLFTFVAVDNDGKPQPVKR